ncbi:hypothetical protein GCM10029964_013150 [Kibdelosporangium lantanae]
MGCLASTGVADIITSESAAAGHTGAGSGNESCFTGAGGGAGGTFRTGTLGIVSSPFNHQAPVGAAVATPLIPVRNSDVTTDKVKARRTLPGLLPALMSCTSQGLVVGFRYGWSRSVSRLICSWSSTPL